MSRTISMIVVLIGLVTLALFFVPWQAVLTALVLAIIIGGPFYSQLSRPRTIPVYQPYAQGYQEQSPSPLGQPKDEPVFEDVPQAVYPRIETPPMQQAS